MLSQVHADAVHVDRLIAFEQVYLAKSSERQLLMYSMDKRVRFSILLLTLVSQKDSREALNFILGYLIDYLRDYSYIIHHYLITTEKVNCYREGIN